MTKDQLMKMLQEAYNEGCDDGYDAGTYGEPLGNWYDSDAYKAATNLPMNT